MEQSCYLSNWFMFWFVLIGLQFVQESGCLHWELWVHGHWVWLGKTVLMCFGQLTAVFICSGKTKNQKLFVGVARTDPRSSPTHLLSNYNSVCHDCDIPPSPVHPQSRLHAALFTLNSPWPNLIHTWTLLPPVLTFVCTLQHLQCLCKRTRRDATPFRLARTSLTNHEHSQLIANHRTCSEARASKHNLENLRLCSRATSASYDKSLFSFCIHFGSSSSRFDICTLALPFMFSLLIPGPTHPQCLPLSSVVTSYCTRLAFTPGLTASHSCFHI